MAGVVVSVNVGTPREVGYRGRTVRTAIWKDPVPGRVRVGGHKVEGDEQGNPEVHGGSDKAVYAYAAEDYEWWGAELGRELGPGTFGENLTLRGIEQPVQASVLRPMDLLPSEDAPTAAS